MSGGHSDERRLAFGQVADLYDEARPSYPAAVFDELIACAGLQPGDRLVEVGAGTGKATCALAERGLTVLALEPSAEMARVLRRNCARHRAVEVEEVDFERWAPSGRVRAVVAAQSWHWVAPDVRCARAAAAIEPGGTLAAVWTLPDWGHTDLRDALREAYSRAAPALAADFPMHPASEPSDLAGDWHAEIAAASGFGDARISRHDWSRRYATSDYLTLLATHQDHILLAEDERERLLAAVAAVLDGAGGELQMSFETRLCLARRR